MSFDYTPLWIKLIENKMSKKSLMENANISKSTMDKMYRNEFVSMRVLDRICQYFDCPIEDIVRYTKEKEKGLQE